VAKSYSLQVAGLGAAWDAFVASSPDGTPFITSSYLSHTGCRLGLYYCYNSNELRAVVAVVESSDGASAILDDLVIYSGICFGMPTHGQNRAQQNSERHEIAAFTAAALAERYQRVEFALAPSINDVRPFLWHNYGQENGRYSVDVRYTSYLDIGDFASAKNLEDIEAYKQATGARRQQIRYARRDGVVTEESSDVGLFADFYRRTMGRQGEEVSAEKLDRMVALLNALLGCGAARMFVSKFTNQVAGSAAVYAFDRHRAYYLFGASDPDLRDSPIGTAVLWDAFGKLAAAKVTQVDLEGVNSPRRGWFKMSFGGELRAYYQITKVGQ
jgi:hypothetical protein